MAELLPETLPLAERRAYLVALIYEQERRKSQRGYRLVTDADDTVLEKSTWKQCRTVGTWLESIGWPIRLDRVNWQGYIRWAFTKLKPQLPLPGQLKNWRLVREYMQTNKIEREIPQKSKEQMEELYRRKIRPELLTDHFLRRAGLDG